MADSLRPRAPDADAVDENSTSYLYRRHAQRERVARLALNDISDAIGNVDSALAALCALLGAANGAPISADYLHVLLSPLHEQLEKAHGDLTDLRLPEIGGAA